MSLLTPTPGEVIDRLSIVNLKIEACQKSGMDTKRLTTEAHKLRVYLGNNFTANTAVAILKAKLVRTNRDLWQAEDDVRTPSATVLQIASAAQNITKLNDLRCSLIRQIDKTCGVESIEEKIYAQKEP